MIITSPRKQNIYILNSITEPFYVILIFRNLMSEFSNACQTSHKIKSIGGPQKLIKPKQNIRICEKINSRSPYHDCIQVIIKIIDRTINIVVFMKGCLIN